MREILAAGVNVHRSTISRRVKAMDLQAFKPAKKPLLTVVMRRKQFEVANAYRHRTANDWGRVPWSDGSSITQFGHISPFVRCLVGTRYVSKYTQATLKHPPSIMIWGCISAKGRGGLNIMVKIIRVD